MFAKTPPMVRKKSTSTDSPWAGATIANQCLIVSAMLVITTDATVGNRAFYASLWQPGYTSLAIRFLAWQEIPASTTIRVLFGPWDSTAYLNGVMYVAMPPLWAPVTYEWETGDWASVSAGDAMAHTLIYYTPNGDPIF